MRVTVTGPNLVANRRSRSSWATPRRCPSASITSPRRCSRTARRSRLSCNSWRSKASPSMCSRSSNSPWVIPAAWPPVNHATNPSNRVDDAANAASAVSDAYACIRLLLRKCSGVGTDEPNGEGAPLLYDTPTNSRSSLSHAQLQRSVVVGEHRVQLRVAGSLPRQDQAPTVGGQRGSLAAAVIHDDLVLKFGEQGHLAADPNEGGVLARSPRVVHQEEQVLARRCHRPLGRSGHSQPVRRLHGERQEDATLVRVERVRGRAAAQ